MAFLLWYTNYFVDIAGDKKVDPKNIPELAKIGDISANGSLSAWHVKSQLAEDDFTRHLTEILAQADIKAEDITVTKGIDGGPLKML